jgi:hypothetical protein
MYSYTCSVDVRRPRDLSVGYIAAARVNKDARKSKKFIPQKYITIWGWGGGTRWANAQFVTNVIVFPPIVCS